MDLAVLAQKFGVAVFETLDDFAFVKERRSVLPYLFVRQKKILPVEETEKGVTIAVSDPIDLDSLQEARFLLKKAVWPIYCAAPVIELAIEKCYHQKDEEAKKVFSELSKGASGVVQGSDEEYDLLEKGDDHPVLKMVNTLIIEAIQQGASDIHFEPTEEGLSIRYRIDGVLQKRHVPPREYQLQILTRLKVMAKMDIAEQRLPQDGRIKLKHGGRQIDFRVSTLPIVHGERIVLRILDRANVNVGLDRIGMSAALLKQFRKLIHAPEGIVLVTGPTGSGKTTTLYSAISEIHDSEMNLITIEDPVEYKIHGINQMNVSPRIDLTFAKGLRHILRQDPDVIMIGEIRDKETAEIAIQASLTGHLVLSTLHTNDAPSALTRLADMGIEPYLLASSILGVLAQRLVRKICPHCKTSYVPSLEELAELGLPEGSGPFFKGVGCEACFDTGYKGRCALYELMPVTSKIKAQVLKSQDAQELRKVALEQEMMSLFEMGVFFIQEGITSFAEVLRVTKAGEERG